MLGTADTFRRNTCIYSHSSQVGLVVKLVDIPHYKQSSNYCDVVGTLRNGFWWQGEAVRHTVNTDRPYYVCHYSPLRHCSISYSKALVTPKVEVVIGWVTG